MPGQEHRHAALRALRPTLHLDGGERGALLRHEVDLVVALSPPEELEALLWRPGEKGRPHARLDHATAEVALPEEAIPALVRDRAHEGGVVHHESRRAPAPRELLGVELGERGNHAGLVKKVEVVRDGHGVPRVLKLPEHLVIGELLGGVDGPEAEDGPHERWLAHVFEREHVLGDGGFDDGVAHVGGPAVFVPDKSGSSWVSPEVQVVIQGVPEGVTTLRVRPVRRTDELEPPHERVLETLVQKEGGRAAEQDLDLCAGSPVRIPERLHRTRPLAYLLHLVDGENDGPLIAARHVARLLPLSSKPFRRGIEWIIGTHHMALEVHLREGLREHGALAGLAWADDDLHEWVLSLGDSSHNRLDLATLVHGAPPY